MDDDYKKADHWPEYHTAPKEATFALGVIGAGYSRLEFAFAHVFTVTIGLTSTFTSILLPKISNDIRVALIEDALPQMGYSSEIEAAVHHFIAAYKSLAFNRNMIMHSQIFPGGATTSILLKSQRDGKIVACAVTMTRLRQIADEMENYRNYGEQLANHIALPRIAERFAIENGAPLGLFPLPDRPALPSRLEYTSDPIPLR